MELFYTTKVEPAYFYLEGEEAIHCIKSLRNGTGSTIHASDGEGNYYYGTITHTDKKKNTVTAIIESQEKKRRTQHLGLCIAPTKNADRMEWLVEKAVELGISEIQWIVTQHSHRKTIPMERMNRIAIAAMKQSLQYFLPKIHEIQTFSQWMQEETRIQGIIGYCGNMVKKPLYSIEKPTDQDIYWICIGPEGDFTQSEAEYATHKGLIPVSIGTHRLRTETAALSAISYFYLL